MKRFGLLFMFLLMNALALVIGVSCSNQTPNSAFIAPVQTVAGSNPSFTPTATFTFTITPIPTVPYPVSVSAPYALAIDSNGNQYVGSTGNNLIYQYVAGVLNSAWPNGKTKSSGLTFTAPKAMTTDSLGNLYVVGSGNAVRKYDTNGTFLVQYSPSMSSPQGLACAGTTLYASDTGNQKIIKFALPGGAATTIVDTSTSPIYSPYGIASNSAGTTIFVAGSDNYVHVYTSAGATAGPVSIGLFNAPYDVALDSNNNLFVSDTGNHQIEEFTFGNYISPAEILGLGTLAVPEGIAVDASNLVYVADSGNNLLYQFIP